MSATVVNFAAARAALMLRANAPPRWIAIFVAQMTEMALKQQDAARTTFWREVASLLRRDAPARLAV